MREITVGKNEAGKRLDKLLERILCNAPKSFVYKMLRKKNITLNDTKASGNELLKNGDRIKIFFSDETFDKMSNRYSDAGIPHSMIQSFCERIVYENEDILVADKPDNILSQKARQSDISMNDLLLEYMVYMGKTDKENLLTFTPAFVNRLDRNTTGLMVAGKTYAGLRKMSQVFKDRTADKYYLALVWGKAQQRRHLEAYLSKDEKKNIVTVAKECHGHADKIITEYERIWQCKELALLKVKLVTGRTHQIRAHLAFEGLPVVGDLKYGNEKINTTFRKDFDVRRQMLHSSELVLSKEPAMWAGVERFVADMPDDFERVMKRWHILNQED